jgi:hypothetical protein
MLSAAATNLRRLETAEEWLYAGAVANMLSQVQLIQGSITESLATSEKSIEYSDRSGSVHRMVVSRATYANALHAAGRRETAGQMFDDAEQRQCAYDSDQPLLHGFRGFAYCDFLIGGGNWIAARDRARQTIAIAQGQGWLLQTALDNLTFARAYLGMALDKYDGSEVESRSSMATIARDKFEESIVGLKRSAQKDDVPRGFLARAVLCRSVGNWEGAARDLDEVEELAEPGPMRLFLCDVALERGRISLARLGAFAPLNGVIADCPLRPVVPDSTEAANLKEMAAKQLAIAADYIEACGYHKRTEELAELRAVLRGERKFADLPPRV